MATSCKELTHWKILWSWEGLGAGGKGDDRGWDGWMASLTRWTWVWVNSGNWWWTGRPRVLLFMGSQRVGHDWATELNWTELKNNFHNFRSGVISSVWNISCHIKCHIRCFSLKLMGSCHSSVSNTSRAAQLLQDKQQNSPNCTQHYLSSYSILLSQNYPWLILALKFIF